MIPDSTDLRLGLLSRLHIHHCTIRNELTVRYAQIYTPLKIPTYPTYPDYYSLVIKFNILGLSNFRLLRLVLFEETKGIHKCMERNIGYNSITNFYKTLKFNRLCCKMSKSNVKWTGSRYIALPWRQL